MLRYAVLAAILVGAPGVAGAQQKAPDTPKSPTAVKARAEYEQALKKVEEEFQKKLLETKGKYHKDLDAAREQALAVKDLDEAQRILAAQNDLGDGPPANGSILIVAAWFGWGEKWSDVTALVKRQVRGGELRLKTAGSGMGDPAFGQRKSLVVIYWHRGVLKVAIAADVQPLVIPMPR